MPWHAIVHPDHPIVEVHYSGELTPAELTDALRETLLLAQNNGITRFLGDCTAIGGGHSIVDLYFIADQILSSTICFELKDAILFSALPDSAEKVGFWETTCLNRGLNVRAFTDRQEALAWLLE